MTAVHAWTNHTMQMDRFCVIPSVVSMETSKGWQNLPPSQDCYSLLIPFPAGKGLCLPPFLAVCAELTRVAEHFQSNAQPLSLYDTNRGL